MNNKYYLFYIEEFHLAEVCYSFIFPKSKLKNIGSHLYQMQLKHTEGGNPVINADAYLQTDGIKPLDYYFNLYNFGSIGKINHHVPSIKIYVIHLDENLYILQVYFRTSENFKMKYQARAFSGPSKNISKSDYKKYFKKNIYVKNGLKMKIPITFNSLIGFNLDFRRECEEIIYKLFPNKLFGNYEEFVLNIFHATDSGANDEFWENNYLRSKNYERFQGNKFSFFVNNETKKIDALIRVPASNDLSDIFFQAASFPIAYETLRSKIYNLNNLSINYDHLFSSENKKKVSTKKITDLYTKINESLSILERYKDIPLFKNLNYDDTELLDSFSNNLYGIYHWIKKDSSRMLNIALTNLNRSKYLAERFEKHLIQVSTDKLTINFSG